VVLVCLCAERFFNAPDICLWREEQGGGKNRVKSKYLTFRTWLSKPLDDHTEILDQSHNRYSSNQGPAIITMKRITSVTIALTALFGLAVSGCDKKTSDDLKQKAEETKQTVERKAKEAKEAAGKQIEKAKPKLKEFGEKAKDATQEAMDKTKEAADSAAQKLKEATNTSPQPVSPTPAP
jgi:gas vesicle protein